MQGAYALTFFFFLVSFNIKMVIGIQWYNVHDENVAVVCCWPENKLGFLHFFSCLYLAAEYYIFVILDFKFQAKSRAFSEFLSWTHRLCVCYLLPTAVLHVNLVERQLNLGREQIVLNKETFNLLPAFLTMELHVAKRTLVTLMHVLHQG